MEYRRKYAQEAKKTRIMIRNRVGNGHRLLCQRDSEAGRGGSPKKKIGGLHSRAAERLVAERMRDERQRGSVSLRLKLSNRERGKGSSSFDCFVGGWQNWARM